MMMRYNHFSSSSWRGRTDYWKQKLEQHKNGTENTEVFDLENFNFQYFELFDARRNVSINWVNSYQEEMLNRMVNYSDVFKTKCCSSRNFNRLPKWWSDVKTMLKLRYGFMENHWMEEEEIIEENSVEVLITDDSGEVIKLDFLPEDIAAKPIQKKLIEFDFNPEDLR